MTDKEFCKLDTEYYGEVVDNIKQISFRSFNGEELKEYVEHCIKLNLLTIHVVNNRRELLNALADEFNDSTHTYVGQPLIEKILFEFIPERKSV